MAEMTDEEWQALNDEFDTSTLLCAIGKIDEVRTHLSDGEYCRPPQIRTDLLKLHDLATDVVNKGLTDNARELFEMADDLEMQVSDILEALESVQQVLGNLTELYPESLAEI